ncbi:YdcH family protein [Caenispirillum bisanense]|uniref:YdcH family protein n=1 Tax=Caenispirillum bisanense TaxID=414052 RepID=UPI0031E44B2E
MGYDARFDALNTKHATLEAQLQEEVRRPNPDTAMVAIIKRQKLKIKDELARMSRH